MATPTSVYLTALWAYLHTLQYGFHISALNGIQSPLSCDAGASPLPHLLSHSPSDHMLGLKDCVAMTPAQFGLITAIFTLGGLVGSLSSDIVTRSFGRVRTLQVSSASVLIGSVAVGTANTPIVMMIGRIMIGLGCGLATVTVPLLNASLLPHIKGVTGILSQLSIVFGMLLGQSLAFPFGHAYLWRYVLAVSAGIAVLQFIGGFVTIGEEREEAKTVGGEEARPLLDEEAREQREEVLGIKGLFTSKDQVVRRGLVIVLLTQFSQQLCGISPVMYFSTRILTPVFNANSRYIAIGIILTKIPMTILPALVIQRTGSKPLLLLSAFLMSIFAFLLAIGLNYSLSILSCIAITSFVCSFSFGLGPITWAVLSEVMPPHARTASGSVGLALNWSMNFVMGSSFLPIQEWLSFGKPSGEGNIFFVFVGTCLLAFVGIRWSYAALERVARAE